MDSTVFSVSRRCIGASRIGVGLVAVAVCTAATAQEQRALKSDKVELPGRIYVTVPPTGNPQHGLLAINPNDRTCVTIDETSGPAARVGPGGHRVAFGKLDVATRTVPLVVVDLDRDAEPVTIPGGPWVASWRHDGGELALSRVGRNVPPDERGNWRIKTAIAVSDR